MKAKGGQEGVASNINPFPESRMTAEQKIARRKLSLLGLASDLGNDLPL